MCSRSIEIGCFTNNNRAKRKAKKKSKGYNKPNVTWYVRDLTLVAEHEKPVAQLKQKIEVKLTHSHDEPQLKNSSTKPDP
jgi:Holliday junction resolvase RusA-like endonuclease